MSAIALGKLALEADIPPGVLNVVPGMGETAGKALGLHTVPFGGFKQSGFGRDKSLHAIKKYTDLKTTWIKIR